ncbi:hypothetical protein [Fimbriiglobus ruber]|uniref:Uncharacterized protein n=1 Tax=Fimbriiglobus ruber TaxID=1908690 RepID=A0A225DAB0_9BACT|nr:hypothetical protein [Fimbriiglobus ruber]OWK37903.1 hypothetical protein FRUB_07023 [Fimbriiglobus ruber]
MSNAKKPVAVAPVAEHVPPVIRTAPQTADPLDLSQWSAEVRTLALAAKQAFTAWSSKSESLRADALLSGQRLTLLHRAADAAKLKWKDVLATMDIPQRTATEHEAYAAMFDGAKTKLAAVGGVIEKFSISDVIGIGKGKLDPAAFNAFGVRLPKPEKGKVEKLKEKIEKAQEELDELEPDSTKEPRPEVEVVKVPVGSIIRTADGREIRIEKAITVVLE